MDCSHFWLPKMVISKTDLVKYLIIHHELDIPLSETIDFNKIAEEGISDSFYKNFLKAKDSLSKQEEEKK